MHLRPLMFLTLLAGATMSLPTASAVACYSTGAVHACWGTGTYQDGVALPQAEPGCTPVAGHCVPAELQWGPTHADYGVTTYRVDVGLGACPPLPRCSVGVDTYGPTASVGGLL